ncbi:MAG: protein kinase, partial [Spirochaetes bacterium]|nr:protein kinase [Spirochaetota bacterium]
MKDHLKQGDIVAERYEILEKTGEGGMSLVFKARDKEKKTNVAIKFLKPGVTSSYIEDRIRFKKEVEVVSKFNHPNIVKIFSAGEYKQIPFIVMELLEGESLYDILSRSRVFTTRETVIIIKQILDALSYVHFRGVIHRDLKPANVMIMANKNVKLLDFGIALVKELSEIKKEEEVLGTFGYMSPEATGIVNKPVDERSDLYSLGILFYRLVTGDLPFKGKRTSEILHKQVAMTPQRPGELNKDLSKEMDNVIMKLLEKEPDLRYQSSVGLISDLDRILKGEKGFIIGEKDQKTKLTYRVRLIGRQREYNQITSLFDKAMGGCGSVCLIGGEAGIGKSRLVEELRALVYEHKGCFFVGKCFDQENKVPYQPFKDILDQYLRKIKHFCDKDIQEEAKRLKSELREQIGEIVKLNSNMTNLLGELPDLVKLDAVEKENVRFRMACAKFFSVLSKDKGVVLFLDDLQWADEGSLNLLGEILKIVDRSHVLILGTYRNNEVDERHSLLRIKKFGIENQLPLITIDLQLFNYERMRKLVSEVLGENEKKAEKLTRYIINKTKGNTFFAITLLRELVERNALVWEKGYWRENWEQIEKLKVSANIVDMLLLRLKELPEKVDILLRIGSIIGKEFDIDLLYDLLGEEEEIVVELIDEAIEKQLLERSTEKGKVVFIHDRIKEAFYAKMGSKERIKYHFKVARVFEEKYRDRIDSVIFDLAHHFIEGKDKEKGLKYGLPAAHKAKENYANREAINYYSYVKKILREKGEKDKLYIQVLEGLGDVCRLEGRYPEALENFKQLASLIKDRLHKGRVYHKISDTLFQMGERDEPVKVLDQSLQILKLRRLPRTKSGFFLAFGVRFTIQMLHLFLPWIFINQRYKDDERREIGCKIYMRLGYCYYFIDMIASATAGMMSVNMVDKMKDTVVYSYIHILQSPIYVAIGVFSLGIKYLKMGLKTALKLKDKLMEGFAYAYYCYLFYAWNKLDRSIEAGHKSVNILRSLGERWEIAVAYVFIWWAEYTRGDTIKMKKVLSEYLPLMRQVNDNRTLGWALNGMGKTLTITGSLDNKNFEYLNEGLECEKQVKDPVFIAMLYGSLGRAYLQKGELELAIENGENGVDYFVNSAAPGYWACEVFGIAAEAYQAKIETGRISEEERIKYLKRVTWLCKKALKWGKGYKTFYGLGLRAAAKCCWLKEKKKKAVCYFEKGIRFLERNDHKYELAVTCYDFGRLLMKKEYNRIYNHEKGKALLMRAKAIMEEIGAKPDLARVNHLLGVEEITKEITDEVTPRERLQLEREMTTV